MSKYKILIRNKRDMSFIIIEGKQYVQLNDYDNYVISKCWPYEVRNRKNNKIMKEFIRVNGYSLRLTKNKQVKNVDKHVLIAKTFLHNDNQEKKKYVVRINGDVKDFRLENLYWSTSKKAPYDLKLSLRKDAEEKERKLYLDRFERYDCKNKFDENYDWNQCSFEDRR